MAEDESKIILYATDDGKSQVSLMLRDGRVWLNQKQMAELFAVTKMNMSLHIANILKEKELDESVVKSYFTTAADGKRYNVIYYALWNRGAGSIGGVGMVDMKKICYLGIDAIEATMWYDSIMAA